MKDPYTHTTSPAPLPPPAYAQSPPVLSLANALYAYQPTDTGDLALQPNDNIQVLEHMNNDCKTIIIVSPARTDVSRVARAKRADRPGRHLPPQLRKRDRRKGSTTTAPSNQQLRKYASRCRQRQLLLTARPTDLQARRARQEIRQEDGQCRYLRRRRHHRQQHRQRHLLNKTNGHDWNKTFLLLTISYVNHQAETGYELSGCHHPTGRQNFLHADGMLKQTANEKIANFSSCVVSSGGRRRNDCGA
jgi:hypothetical protein